MATIMNEIEHLALQYGERYRELEAAVRTMEDAIRTIKREMIPHIRRLAAESAEQKEVLVTAVRGAPELFVRPRTRLIGGVKLGIQKRRGQVVIADEARTIELMRKLLPANQVEVLVRVREEVHKQGVYDLVAGDLKRLGIEIKADTDQPFARIAADDIDVERIVDALLNTDVDAVAG